jgi:hypothetical protein
MAGRSKRVLGSAAVGLTALVIVVVGTARVVDSGSQSATVKLCALLRARAPIAVGGAHPSMGQLLAAPFTDTPLDLHYDVVVFLRARDAWRLSDFAGRLGRLSGVVKAIEFDQRAAFDEFRSLGLNVGNARGQLAESDMPPSVRLVLDQPSDADAFLGRSELRDPIVYTVTGAATSRWLATVSSSTPLRDAIAAIDAHTAGADLPGTAELVGAWRDVFSVKPSGDPGLQSADLFPSARLDELEARGRSLLAAERRRC